MDNNEGIKTMTDTYQCSVCGELIAVELGDETPVCNNTDACGLLFDDEIVETACTAADDDVLGLWGCECPDCLRLQREAA